MDTKIKIMIIDNDLTTSKLVSTYLEEINYMTRCIQNGDLAIHAINQWNPNLILLDIILQGKDGYDVCKEIRLNSNIPIIIISSKGDVFDKVLGLELGADDYLVKPFDNKELSARIKAVLRRYTPSESSNREINLPNLTINQNNYSVIHYGKKIEMPPKEFELLYFLSSHPNQVFTREQLLDRIWGYEYLGDTRTVDVHIKRIRSKITPNKYWIIKTVWGIGYKFELL